MKSISRIAIVKLSAMGDIIHAMVALQFIKKKYPNILIDWFVEESFKGVLENNPYINSIYTVNLKKFKKEKKFILKEIQNLKKYSENNYDLIIDAQGLIKSAIVSKFLGKNIAGFSKNSIREKVASFFYKQKVEISYDSNTIDRNVKVLCEPLNIEVTKQDILNKEAFLFSQDIDYSFENLISTEKKNIIFIIGSTWESRNYPKEKFLEISNSLRENILISWGNEEEKEKALWIEKNSSYVKVVPKMNLDSLKALISRCDLLIGNDTGPTHMAWGLNIPSITIFGPTPVNRVYQTSINKVIKSNSKVNHFKLDKNDFSIKEIEVEDILLIANKLL